MFVNKFPVPPPKYTYKPPRDWLPRLRALLATYPQDDLASTEALCCRVIGDFTAGMVLHRLLYWQPKGCRDDGAIWKSDREWYAELNLSYAQMQRARSKLAPVVRSWVEKARGAPTHHYQLRLENLLLGFATVLSCSIIEVKLALLDRVENGFSAESRMDFRQSRESITNQPQTLPAPQPILMLSDPPAASITPAPAADEAIDSSKTGDSGEEEMQAARRAWAMALLQMKVQFHQTTIEPLLHDARLLSYAANVFRIGVSSDYARAMLQHRAYREVRRVLSDCFRFGQPVEIEFSVAPGEKVEAEPAPLHRQLASQNQATAPSAPPPTPSPSGATSEAQLVAFGLAPDAARRWAYLDPAAVADLIERVRRKQPRAPLPYITTALCRMEDRLRDAYARQRAHGFTGTFEDFLARPSSVINF